MKVLATALAAALWLTIAGPVLAQGQRISIDVRDVSISDVIALLASQSGRNIVADASVKPDKVTLHLQNVSFDEALSVLVHSRELEVRHEGNVLIVGTGVAMNRRYPDDGDSLSSQTAVVSLRHAKAEDVSKAMVDALPIGTVVVPDKRTDAVIVTGDANTVMRARKLIVALDSPSYGANGSSGSRAYALRYMRPSEVTKDLKNVLPDGSYIADDRQNAIIVTGNAEIQETANAFLTNVDVPSPQVELEVRVIDLQPNNESSNIGFQFGGAGLDGKPLAGGTTYAFTRTSIAINATLNALVTQGRAQILATPRLVTLNNHEANLLIGQTYPVVYYDARLGGQQVQFVDVGVKLKMIPTIGRDGSVTAEMHPEYSAIQDFVGGYPILANRKVDSTLRVSDGSTIVLGGLLRDIDSETVTKVPYLGDVPVFGKIFRNRQRSHEKDEIVFLITPHILTGNQTISK